MGINKLVAGVGIYERGKYLSRNSSGHTIEYDMWEKMLSRCYRDRIKNKYTTYKDCTVCKEWLTFQNFAEWFHNNYYEIDNETMCLDKDILVKGNKIYSPETCIFVPKRINLLFIKADANRGEFPVGVQYNKHRNYYTARLNTKDSRKHLGCFDNPVDAFNIYKQEKEKYIKLVADEYKSKIPPRLYEAMLNFYVDIND